MSFIEFIGYAVCYAGGTMIVCTMITGCCMWGNRAVRALLGWYGGWKTFLIYREWLQDEEHKKFVAMMQNRVQKEEK